MEEAARTANVSISRVYAPNGLAVSFALSAVFHCLIKRTHENSTSEYTPKYSVPVVLLVRRQFNQVDEKHLHVRQHSVRTERFSAVRTVARSNKVSPAQVAYEASCLLCGREGAPAAGCPSSYHLHSDILLYVDRCPIDPQRTRCTGVRCIILSVSCCPVPRNYPLQAPLLPRIVCGPDPRHQQILIPPEVDQAF